MKTLRIRYLKKFKEKSVGLIGKSAPFPVMIKTRFGIHTIGLRFAIDVLILDTTNTVVKIAREVRPNTIFLWPIKYDTVIELPAGEVIKKGIRLGEKIRIVTSN